MINPTLKVLKRDKFYFDQYQYSLTVRVELAGAIRDFKGDYEKDRARAHDHFEWRERILQRTRHGLEAKIHEERRTPVYHLLKIFCDRIADQGRDFKVIITLGQVCVYSSDYHWISGITDIFHNSNFTKIELAYPPDTVALVRPTGFQFRTYLKQKMLSADSALYLRNWLKNQQDVRLSPGLHVWSKNVWRDTASGYFFEHNDLRMVSMLNIVVPDMIKNTKTIIVVDK